MKQFVCLFFIFQFSVAQEIVVKRVKGNVFFELGDKKIVVKNYSSFSDQNGFFVFEDDTSSILFRIDQKLDLLSSSKEKKHALKDLLNIELELANEEASIVKIFFDWIFDEGHDENKIDNKMALSKTGSVSRNGSIDITCSDIEILSGFPFKIDFSNFLDYDKSINNEYNIHITDMLNQKKTIDSLIISNPFFEFPVKDTTQDYYWHIKITDNYTNTKLMFYAFANAKKHDKKIFNELKDKAILESKTEKTTYQMIFIESLLSHELIANAHYFLDLFIDSNKNQKLIHYKNHYFTKTTN